MATTIDYNCRVEKAGFIGVDILLLDPKTVKHAFDKQLSIIAQPKGGVEPITLLIDLQRLKEVITVTGILEDGSGTASAITKKNNLRSMLTTAGIMTIKWDSNDTNQPYSVNLIKGEIEETAETHGDEDDTKTFGVTMQFIIGTHIG